MRSTRTARSRSTSRSASARSAITASAPPISNTEGLGIEGYWGHRNLFGRAEKLRIEGSISRIGDTTDYDKLNYNAAIMFEKPGVIGPPSKFFANRSAVSGSSGRL